MDPKDSPNPSPVVSPREPWHCNACGVFQYAKDENGSPAPGAPISFFYDNTYPRVCRTCFDMVMSLEGKNYWKKLHTEYLAEEARRKDKADRLTDKKDYFDGQ